MLDFTKEKPVSLQQVAEFCQCKLRTVQRWTTEGVGGRVLATRKIGGLVRTTMEELQRFSQDATPNQQSVHVPIPAVATRSDWQTALKERHGI